MARAAKTKAKAKTMGNTPARRAQPRARVTDVAGGTPVSFGYRTAWLAIPNADPRDVAEALAIQDPRPCAWDAGIGGVARDVATFITPPIDGYTLVVDSALGDTRRDTVRALSRRFGTAQLFVTQRVIDDYACLEAKAGKIVRTGKPTDEDEVLAQAALWSVDPQTLDGRPPTPMGLVARSANAAEAERLAREEVLLQRPARSVREAQHHLQATFRLCPGCNEPHFATWYPGRRPLPWETFATAVPLICANGPCQRHFLITYPPAATYDVDLAADDVRVTTSDTPSELLDGAGWLSIVERRIASLREMPEWEYDDETLARESRRFAREAIGCALEAAKHGARVAAKLRRWLDSVVRDGLSTE
jgi:hypothetical protein